jgi:hypothetical protein
MVLTLFVSMLVTSVMAMISNDLTDSERPGGAEVFETNQQETIELESWMLVTPLPLSNRAAERPIRMESWMLNSNSFKTTEELKMERLEEWTTAPQSFQTIEEKKLNVLEEWMTDKNFWNI